MTRSSRSWCVAQVARVIVLLSSVTAPLRASALPCSVAPVVIEIESRAMMMPTNWLPVPIVAELPTCQKTLQACAPPISVTAAPEPVVRVEPAWKMKTALGSPWASSVRSPLRPSEVAEV